jgi:transposase
LIVNEALGALERELAALHSAMRRPSIAPEKLLRAMLLQAFYSIGWAFTFAAAAYNSVRLPKLMAVPA